MGIDQHNDVDVQTLRSCAKELYVGLKNLFETQIDNQLTYCVDDAEDPFAKAEKLLEKYKSLSV